ncbi:MAG: ABC transporter transmembrane domain-containing protein [Polyangiaceae bacterium]
MAERTSSEGAGANSELRVGGLVLTYRASEIAEPDAAVVGKHLCKLVDALRARLGAEGASKERQPIRVALGGSGAGAPEGSVVGSVKASSVLECALARRVAADVTGLSAFGRLPDALVVGLVHYVERREVGSGTELDPVLGAWLATVEDLSLASILKKDASSLRPVEVRTAGAFIAWLWERGGAAAFTRLAREHEKSGLEAAIEAVYGAPFEELSAQFRRSVELVPPKKLKILGVFGRTLSYWRPHAAVSLSLLAMIGIQQLFFAVYAIGLKSIIDGLLEGKRDLSLPFIVGGLGVAFIAAAAAALYGEYLTAKISVLILNDLRKKMFEHLQALSTDYYLRNKGGDIVSRFSGDLETLKKSLTERIVTALTVCIGLVINAPMLLVFDWRLGLLVFCLSPIMIFAVGRVAPSAADAGYELKKSEGDMITTVQENVRAQAVVKAFTLQGLLAKRFSTQLEDLADRTVQSDFRSELVGVIPSLGVLFTQLVVTAVGAWMALAGHLSAGALVAFLTLLTKVSKDTYELAKKVLPAMIKASSGLRRIDELLFERPHVRDAEGAKPIPELKDGIALENVTFSYTGEVANLKNLSLFVPKNSYAAFVGPSGSGKSSVLNLVMRFYDPSSGAVTFDGTDIRTATLASVRNQLGIVFQENFLFNTSVRENIRLGREGATDEEIVAAAKAAALHDIVVKLPGGYDSEVGEAGGKLSGGQRQRVAIARAMVRDPAVLVLDEATSALDPATEHAVNETIQQLAKGRTVLSVTHRLASVVAADKIFVLRDGELAEEGTHDALLAKQGLYAQLWGKQTGFEVSEDGRHATVDKVRLRQIPLFAEVEDEALLARLATEFTSEFYEEGQVVVEEGKVVNRLFILVRGRAETLSRTFLQAQRRLGGLDDGDAFGTLALVRDEPSTSTVRTIDPCLFITLRRDHFLAALEASRAVAAAARAMNKQHFLERLFGPRAKGARPPPVDYVAADLIGLKSGAAR